MSFGRNKPFNRKCKICGNKFKTNFSNVQWCSAECGVALAKIRVEKEREKARLKREKEDKARIKAVKERLKSRGEWLADLQKVFNQFIRLRDKDLPCISCGRYHQGQWHAGHYRSVGACPELRFDEMNVHKQCSVCNNYKSGNLTEYRLNLIRKIGEEEVERLDRKDHPPLKLSVDEIKALIQVYKAKVRELQDEKH
ncbi:recombination protein NinG [Haemophilus haemoglobinophilus]|nr:recombination protein NinG [Canicola haemoglobinophilus]